jgi:deoxyribodipyrimidine photolyase-related protein
LILGDQLDEASSAFQCFDPVQDVVLMVEAFEESTHVWSHKVLMEGDQPVGGQWNFDADNRKGFGKAGPDDVPKPLHFKADGITASGIALVENKFADHHGDLSHFNWPVTREQALVALNDFIDHRLRHFGAHQDAMWTGVDFGWHALLSSSLNLKLLNPLEVVLAAEQAYKEHDLDLPSVEGFIRQILGWREFMRGVYFLDMPAMKTANHFRHENALPAWYWTGETKMNCMRQSISQTLVNGYSHQIQRLMVTGMFGVTAHIKPQAVCDWYLAVYVDAVEWVELPNTPPAWRSSPTAAGSRQSLTWPAGSTSNA